MSDTRPIGVFDSGIGGLTVVHEIFKRLPNEKVVYFGDTARVPYGTKSPKVVEKFALQDIFFLLEKDVKLLVAACHTVSAVALEDLVKIYHFPILGVVDPGVKAALKVTKNKRIGVIGTKATVNSQTYERKIKQKNPDMYVVTQACSLFVPLAEEGWLDTQVNRDTAHIYLDPVIKEDVDTLILGCTHYPLLKPVIQDIMGEGVTVIDSAEETAKLVADRLGYFKKENPNNLKMEHQFFVSDIPHQFREVGERFLGQDLGDVRQVDLESLNMNHHPNTCPVLDGS